MKPDFTPNGALAWQMLRDAMDHVEESNLRIEEIAKERDGLWAQVTTLREAFFDLREIGKSFPAPVTHECIEPTGECYDCLRIAFDKCADALAATPAQALEASKAPLVAQVAAFDSIRSELLDIVQKYAAQSTSSDGGCTPGGLEHMGDVWTLLTRWGTVLARTPAQALDAFKAPYEARIDKLVNALGFSLEVIGKSEATATEKFVAVLGGNQALSTTPLTALAAYRRKVLEEAVEAVRKECEVYSEFQNENAVLMAAAEVIRRMAGEAKDAS